MLYLLDKLQPHHPLHEIHKHQWNAKSKPSIYSMAKFLCVLIFAVSHHSPKNFIRKFFLNYNTTALQKTSYEFNNNIYSLYTYLW